MISLEEMKKRIEDMGYYASEELIYDAFNALLMFDSTLKEPGQDIYAITLEGPPGAGKTEFAKVYTKVAQSVFKNVEMVDYQCDATTGKTELFEDINISAAIRGDADNVNIPGKLIDAIKKVNEGKKVVLFIDEYDKAREETDAFLLQFLQSGKINSTQHGDLEIKEEYKTNLQVILCKNDMREELSGPLSRRTRKIVLEEMKPEVFFKVARKSLSEKIDGGLINLVSLMYKDAYQNKEMYNRLPSCSEMLIALTDADRMMKYASAPKNIIYNILIRGMFKNKDDITTFESSINSDLKKILEDMKKTNNENKEKGLNDLIKENLYKDEIMSLIRLKQEVKDFMSEYREKLTNYENEVKIKLNNGSVIKQQDNNVLVRNFNDESLNIKRGFSVNEISDNWNIVATIEKKNLSHDFYVSTICKFASELEVKVLEDAVIIDEVGPLKLVAVKNKKDMCCNIMCNSLVLPSIFLKGIKNYIDFLNKCYEMMPKNSNNLMNNTISIDTLIYDNNNLDLSNNLPKEEDNVFYLNASKNEEEIREYLDNIISACNFSIQNPMDAYDVSNKMIAKRSLN